MLAVVAGVAAAGTFDTRLDGNEIPLGSSTFMLVLAIALVVGFVAYALVEWLQTRRLDSIARQFTTRTILLMPIAIALNIVLGQTVAAALKLPIYLDSIGTILVGVLAGPIAGAATGLLSNLAWTFLLGATPFGSPFAWPFAIVAVEIGLLAGIFGWAGIFRPRPNTPPARFVAGLAVAIGLLGALAWYGILPHYAALCAEPATTGGGCLDPFRPGADPLFLALAYGMLALVAVAAVALLVRLAARRDLGVVYVLVAGAACGVVSALIAAPIVALMFGGVTGSGTDLLVLAFQRAGSDLQNAVLQQALISDPIDKAITFLIVFTLVGAMSRRAVARFPQGERSIAPVDPGAPSEA